MRGSLLIAVLAVILLGMMACSQEAQAHWPYRYGYGYGYGGYGYRYYSPPRVYVMRPYYHNYPMFHVHYSFQRAYYPRYW